MKRAFFYLLVLACLFLSVRVFFSAQELWQENPMPWAGSPDDEAPPETSVQPLEETTREVTVAAVGDIMVHQTQYVRAYDPRADCYDFSPSFESIAPYLQEADLVVGNLETVLGGKKLGFSAYPRFNSPDEIASALREAGFNLLCTANNHCLDKGEQGLYRTIEVLEQAGIKHFGTARSREERDAPLLVEANGITLGFLAYTYGTNGLPVPAGKDYIVNLLVEEQMQGDIAQARSQGADLVILYLHWGEEYRFEPAEEQQRLAKAAAAAGADIILGSHPHVIQPMEYLHVQEEGGGEKRVFVAYSLGNFLSNQHRSGGIPTDEVEIGQIIYLCLEKNDMTGETYLKNITYLPTWVDRSGKHRILPLDRILAGETFAEEDVIPASLAGRLRGDLQSIQDRLDGFELVRPLPVVQ